MLCVTDEVVSVSIGNERNEHLTCSDLARIEMRSFDLDVWPDET
jgi:hypothetical protein